MPSTQRPVETMPEYGTVCTPEAIAQAFTFLKTTGTLVRMVSERVGFERLVVVTDLRSTLTGRMVVLDAPADLDTLVMPAELPTFRFEYTGPDNLTYVFRSSRSELRADGLWLLMPEAIERIQRRGDYRVTAPMGCWLSLTTAPMAMRAKVIDLSVGGARCHLSIGRYGQSAAVLHSGMCVVGLDLLVPRDDDVKSVHIHTGRVAWLTRDTDAGRIQMALVFTEMDRLAVNRLTREIYHIQRRLLRLRQVRD